MKWTSDIAYAIGLITTDGSLSIDGRHINLTSKDKEQILNFAKALNLKNKIGLKYSSFTHQRKYYQIQFGNVKFYHFLGKIGLTTNKTKTIGQLKIPDRYFIDFLRGHFDGDGCTYSYWDPRWKSSFMLYTTFTSASKKHLVWLKHEIKKMYKIEGQIGFQGKSTFNLRYAKQNSLILLKKIYYKDNLPCLRRKRLKIKRALDIINREAEVEELEDSPL